MLNFDENITKIARREIKERKDCATRKKARRSFPLPAFRPRGRPRESQIDMCVCVCVFVCARLSSSNGGRSFSGADCSLWRTAYTHTLTP